MFDSVPPSGVAAGRALLVVIVFAASTALGGPACSSGGGSSGTGGPGGSSGTGGTGGTGGLGGSGGTGAIDAIERPDALDAPIEPEDAADATDSPTTDAPAEVAPPADGGVIGEWAVFVNDDSQNDILAVAPYPDGSSLASGWFLINGTLLGAPTAAGGFLIRLNADGTLAWKQTARIPSVTKMVTLPDGTFVGVGYSIGLSVVFGPGEPKETTLPGRGGGLDPYLARFNGDGTLVWANRAGVTTDWGISAFDALADGSSFVAGTFGPDITFGAGTPQAVHLVAGGGADPCIARYTPAGALVWAKQITGPAGESLNDLKALADGSTVAVGSFWMPAIFGRGEARETTLTPAGGVDAFVARFASDGSLEWARAIGVSPPATVGVRRLALLPDGTFYITGYFSGTISFGAGGPSITGAGSRSGFLARGRADGSIAWARPMNGDASDSSIDGMQLVRLANGDLVVAGDLYRGATFGAGTPAAMAFTPLGLTDQFMARFSAAGDFVSGLEIGGPIYESVTALAPSGDAVIAGVTFGSLGPDTVTRFGFSSSVTLRPGTARQVTYTGQYYDDFIGRIVP